MSDPSSNSPKGPRPGESTGIFRRLTGEPYATAVDREELISILSRHIGPVARVMVERIDLKRLTRNDLFMAAAQELEDDSVRERFMKEVGLYR
jgi:hypothetical protein